MSEITIVKCDICQCNRFSNEIKEKYCISGSNEVPFKWDSYRKDYIAEQPGLTLLTYCDDCETRALHHYKDKVDKERERKVRVRR